MHNTVVHKEAYSHDHVSPGSKANRMDELGDTFWEHAGIISFLTEIGRENLPWLNCYHLHPNLRVLGHCKENGFSPEK